MPVGTTELVAAASRARYVVSSPADLAAVAELRYQLFVARDGKAYAHADHRRRRLLEPIDRQSVNFAVIENGRCAIAVRLSPSAAAASDPLLAPAIEQIASTASLETLVVVSRLVNRETRRATSLIRDLFRDVYRVGFVAGANRCLACARPEIAPLFELFGFLQTGQRITDKVAGGLSLLLLDLHDGDHLEARRSPLLPVYRALSDPKVKNAMVLEGEPT